MKKMKRLLAVLLAAVMVMGMSVTAFANETTEVPTTPLGTPSINKDAFEKPDKDDKAMAIVQNVEAGATVTAYRIVKPTYNDKGFTGYELADGVTLEKMLEPTAGEVTGIAADKELLKTLESAELKAPEGATENPVYGAELGAGYWVVVVTGSTIQQIYNPMLIGIYYAVEGSGDNGMLVNGIVDASKKWTLKPTDAYAKSEQPTIDKKIVGSTDKTQSDGNANGNDVAIGDIVKFEIETQIPSYSESYTEVEVTITDTLSKGLKLADSENLVVKVGGTTDDKIVSATATDPETSEVVTNYTYTPDQDRKGFTISFESDYALEHSGEKIYVTYDAQLVVEKDADGKVITGYNFDANTNKATLEYTNDPNGETNEIDDTTYTYTFAIDANLYGESTSGWNKFTEELLKTGEKRVIDLGNGETKETTTLPGAEFTLTRAEKKTVTGTDDEGNPTEEVVFEAIPETKYVYKTDSDENGYLTFKGLDAGCYVLQETKAPEGYSLNEAVIPVEISAEYNDDGTLDYYEIKIDNEKTSTYTATYDKDTKEITEIKCEPGHDNNLSDVSDTFEIKNTTLAKLPSTGGIGTTIFTIGGCAIMVIAAALFFATRRKAEK